MKHWILVSAMALFVSVALSTNSASATAACPDMNGDGVVDLLDISVASAHDLTYTASFFGTTCPPEVETRTHVNPLPQTVPDKTARPVTQWCITNVYGATPMSCPQED